MPEERLIRRRAQRQAAGALRQRRVAESRRRADLAGRLSRRRHVAEAEAEAEAALPAESPQVNLEAPAELEAPEEPEEDRAEEDGDEEGGADGGPTDESEKGE